MSEIVAAVLVDVFIGPLDVFYLDKSKMFYEVNYQLFFSLLLSIIFIL